MGGFLLTTMPSIVISSFPQSVKILQQTTDLIRQYFNIILSIGFYISYMTNNHESFSMYPVVGLSFLISLHFRQTYIKNYIFRIL